MFVRSVIIYDVSVGRCICNLALILSLCLTLRRHESGRHGSLRKELKVKTPLNAVEKWYELDEKIFKQKLEEFKNKILPLKRKLVVEEQQPCETQQITT